MRREVEGLLSLVQSVLRYTPETGELFWRKNRGSAAAGSLAGTFKTRTGTCCILLNRMYYMRSRFVWLLETGELPVGIIHHLNGVMSDDHISNLAVGDFRNFDKMRGSSQDSNVHWNKQSRCWVCIMRCYGKTKTKSHSRQVDAIVFKELVLERLAEGDTLDQAWAAVSKL